MSKLSIARDLFGFLASGGRWWMLPVVIVLVVLGLIIALAQGSVVAPFIYTLF